MRPHPVPLHTLSFCGIDTSVSTSDLLALSTLYPFVEWGVLFNDRKEGTDRFPRMDWVEGELRECARVSNGGLRVSVCNGVMM